MAHTPKYHDWSDAGASEARQSVLGTLRASNAARRDALPAGRRCSVATCSATRVPGKATCDFHDAGRMRAFDVELDADMIS